MNKAQTSSLSRRLGPVFAEVAAQAANAQQGPKSGQQGVENPNPMPAPSKAYKPAREAPSKTVFFVFKERKA